MVYVLDAFHRKLSDAETALIEAQPKVDRLATVSDLLGLLLAAKRVGPGATSAAMDAVAERVEMIAELPQTIEMIRSALGRGRAALADAREAVPNTSPPDPRGYE